MIQNSTIFEKSAEASKKGNLSDQYITFGNTDISPLKQFEEELQSNLDDLGTSRNNPKKHETHYQTKPLRYSKKQQYDSIKQDELTVFVNNCFKKETQIKCDHFVREALNHFLPKQKITERQFAHIVSKMKKILATSNPQCVSLNALKVLNEQRPFRTILYEIYLDGKYKIKHKELDTHNSKILEQLSFLQKQITMEENSLTKRLKQIEKKQGIVNNKQKELMNRQKDFKAIISKQYQRLQAKLTKLYSDRSADLDKKSANVERGLKYKIQIMDKKIEELNTLKNGQKINNDKFKDKITKLQKQNKELKNKLKDADMIHQQILIQQQDQMKKQKLFEQKITKLQKKISSLKQQAKIKHNQISTLQQLLHLKQQQLKAQLVQSNPQKQLKQKQSKKIVKKSKHEQQQQALLLLISFTSTFISAIQNYSMKLVNSFILQPEKHLSMPQILFPQAEPLIKSFYLCFSQLLSQHSGLSLTTQAITIISSITQLIFFCHKYMRIQKAQNILEKVFQNNKLKSPQKKQQAIYYHVDDEISSKIIKQIKKILKNCEFSETLMMSIFSFISASSTSNKSASLVIITEIITDSIELKQKLIDLQFVPLFLTKINFQQAQQIEPFLDVILQLATQEQLRTKLFEGMYITETYKDFWLMLPVLPDKASIILQRFYYCYKSIGLEQNQVAVLKNLKNSLDKDSLQFANLVAIQSYFK